MSIISEPKAPYAIAESAGIPTPTPTIWIRKRSLPICEPWNDCPRQITLDELGKKSLVRRLKFPEECRLILASRRRKYRRFAHGRYRRESGLPMPQ